MPRATSTSTEEKEVKKAPRKRATPKAAAAERKTTPRKTTPRKTAAKKPAARTTRKSPAKRKVTTESVDDDMEEFDVINGMEEEEDVDEEVSHKRSTRKAPTQFAEVQALKTSKRNQYIVIALLLIVGIGASAAVGLSDPEAGQINVAQAIKERNERMANLVDVDGPTVMAPTPSQLPDGGFIGLRPADPSAAPAPIDASSTATSSDAGTDVASSTDEAGVPTDEAAALQEQFATDTATTTVEAVESTSQDQLADGNL